MRLVYVYIEIHATLCNAYDDLSPVILQPYILYHAVVCVCPFVLVRSPFIFVKWSKRSAHKAAAAPETKLATRIHIIYSTAICPIDSIACLVDMYNVYVCFIYMWATTATMMMTMPTTTTTTMATTNDDDNDNDI